MAQNGSPAESLSNWQQENEDFGGLFRSSISLAYGDEDDTGNIPQPEYSFLEDLNESGPQSSPESPMAASNSSSTCANCEQLKRQIDVLKRNQMPGTVTCQITCWAMGLYSCKKAIFKRQVEQTLRNVKHGHAFSRNV